MDKKGICFISHQGQIMFSSSNFQDRLYSHLFNGYWQLFRGG